MNLHEAVILPNDFEPGISVRPQTIAEIGRLTWVFSEIVTAGLWFEDVEDTLLLDEWQSTVVRDALWASYEAKLQMKDTCDNAFKALKKPQSKEEIKKERYLNTKIDRAASASKVALLSHRADSAASNRKALWQQATDSLSSSYVLHQRDAS